MVGMLMLSALSMMFSISTVYPLIFESAPSADAAVAAGSGSGGLGCSADRASGSGDAAGGVPVAISSSSSSTSAPAPTSNASSSSSSSSSEVLSGSSSSSSSKRDCRRLLFPFCSLLFTSSYDPSIPPFVSLHHGRSSSRRRYLCVNSLNSFPSCGSSTSFSGNNFGIFCPRRVESCMTSLTKRQPSRSPAASSGMFSRSMTNRTLCVDTTEVKSTSSYT